MGVVRLGGHREGSETAAQTAIREVIISVYAFDAKRTTKRLQQILMKCHGHA